MQVFRMIQEELEAGRPLVLCVITETRGSVPRGVGSKMLVFFDGKTSGSIGGGELESRVINKAQSILENGTPQTFIYQPEDEEKQVHVYLEPQRPEAQVVIIGAGHVGKAIAELAKWLGFMVVLCDDREEVLEQNGDGIADKTIFSCIEDMNGNLNLRENSYVILCNRTADIDIQLLPEILTAKPAYVGALGSRKRWQVVKESLVESGVEDKEIRKVHAPIGIKIGAETPEEIAVSVLAEIISAHRKEK